MKYLTLTLFVVGIFLLGCSEESKNSGKTVIRVGHFPNITHAQGLIAHQMTREQKGWFEQRLGPNVQVEWFVYNAGPSAMEALLADSIDLSYVGPNPALNAHLKTQGEEIRVVAGATYGGAALVVQGDGRLQKPADFKGKRIATPQFGNTQDVSCRAWLEKNGFKITQTGGDVEVMPMQNPDQLALFQKGELDAAWTVEPWVSRLELEAKGKIFLQEEDAITTVLVSSVKFLKEKPELAKKFIQAHNELNEWINANQEQAMAAVQKELAAETTRALAPEVLKHCWSRMHFKSEISVDKFQSFLEAAQKVGFLKEAGSLSRLVETPK